MPYPEVSVIRILEVNRAQAARASSGRAAETMLSRNDVSSREELKIEVADMRGLTRCRWQPQHLIEIAVEQRSIPANRNHLSAHDSRDRGWIKGINQSLHVQLILLRLDKVFKKSTDWHIRDGEKTVELDAVLCAEKLAVLLLERSLIGWERGANRIEDECQR